MSKPHNRLTPAQAERFAMLAEEAGEIVQNVGKILRHGLDSWHPDHPGTSNRDLLTRELADLEAVRLLLCQAGDIGHLTAEGIAAAKQRKLHFSHHQPMTAAPEASFAASADYMRAMVGDAD